MTNYPTIAPIMAERHEALWLRLRALHATIAAIAAKKPEAPVGETERVAGEGLLAECWPFLRHGIGRLPVASPYFAGLAVQLSQVLALMEAFENTHSFWDGDRQCRSWRVKEESLPIGRLRQQVAGTSMTTYHGKNMREELVRLYTARESRRYEDGFRAGQAARIGPPDDLV